MNKLIQALNNFLLACALLLDIYLFKQKQEPEKVSIQDMKLINGTFMIQVGKDDFINVKPSLFGKYHVGETIYISRTKTRFFKMETETIVLGKNLEHSSNRH